MKQNIIDICCHLCYSFLERGVRLVGIYDINNIQLHSVIRVGSESEEGKTKEYNGYCQHYELICSLSGESEITFQKITMLEKTGTVRFLPRQVKNNIYTVKTIKTGEDIDIFFATDTILPDTMFIKDYSANSALGQLFIKIHNVWSRKETGYYNKCVSIFFAILSEMQKSDLKFSPKSHLDKISDGVKYIHDHYCELDFDYQQLANVCNISYTYFKKIFREIYKTTPSEYVKNLKVEKACELLSTKRFSVSQIAELCGYENVYYFSKVFKDTMAMSPSEYKKEF